MKWRRPHWGAKPWRHDRHSDELDSFAPSLARAHTAVQLLEQWSGGDAAELREDLLIAQMAEATLDEPARPRAPLVADCVPGFASTSDMALVCAKPSLTLSVPSTHWHWPVLVEPEGGRSPTLRSAWCGRASTMEAVMSGGGITFCPPALYSPSIAIEALDLASGPNRRARLRRSVSLGVGWSRGSYDAESNHAGSGLAGISKAKRAARRVAKATHAASSARARRGLPLWLWDAEVRGLSHNPLAEAAARRGRHALWDAALASRFGDGLSLQPVPEE